MKPIRFSSTHKSLLLVKNNLLLFLRFIHKKNIRTNTFMPGQTAPQSYFHTIEHPVCELSVASHLLLWHNANAQEAISLKKNKNKFKEFATRG